MSKESQSAIGIGAILIVCGLIVGVGMARQEYRTFEFRNKCREVGFTHEQCVLLQMGADAP